MAATLLYQTHISVTKLLLVCYNGFQGFILGIQAKFNFSWGRYAKFRENNTKPEQLLPELTRIRIQDFNYFFVLLSGCMILKNFA